MTFEGSEVTVEPKHVNDSPANDSSATRIVVTGVGTICSWGEDVEQLWQNLCDGEAAYGPSTSLADQTGEHGDLQSHSAAEVSFDPRGRFPGRNIRPVDRTGRLAIIAAENALESSGWTEELRAEHLVGLSLGTLFGSVQTISAFDRRGLEAGPKYVKPLDFANTVINAAAGQTAIWHGLRGTNSTVAGGSPASLQAIGQARDLLRAGRADAMLAGGAEELCFESFYGFQQAGLLAVGQDPEALPFDARGAGLVLAEGAALLALETEARAVARGVKPRAMILGHGSAFDPSRGRKETSSVRAMDRAVRSALADAQIEPGEVDVVFAGSHGRPSADRAEALGLQSVFAGRNGSGTVPVTAIKASLGESLGAAGAFQTLALVQAIEHGHVPATRGLEKLPHDLHAPSLDFCRQPRDLRPRVGLVTSMGLDGNAVALVVGAPNPSTGAS